MRATVFVSLILAVAGCHSASPRGDQVGNSDVDSIQIAATLLGDTVLLRQVPGDNRLVWTRASDGDALRWVSETFEMAHPEVTLAFVTQEEWPELFFTVLFEEFVFGTLLTNGPGGPRVAFQSSDRACRVPEIRDVTGDGMPEILDFEAMALAPEECTGDPFATTCQSSYPTEWVQIHRARADGRMEPDTLAARRFYADLALAYRTGAAELESAIRSPDAGGPPSHRCDMEMVESLRLMEARAARIAASSNDY